MEFVELRDKLISNFNAMVEGVDRLFEVELDRDELWNTYLDSFPAGTNPIYRERRVYDCSCCRHFIKDFGNVVIIKDGIVKTIWDFETEDDTYQPVMDALSSFVKSHNVFNVFVSKYGTIGTKQNREMLSNGDIKTWDHFFLELPSRFVDKTSRSIGDIQGTFRDTRNVFKRSLDEITEDAILTILELISSNTLYRGEEWKNGLNSFLRYKREYDKLQTEKDKELYAWEKSVEVGVAVGKIRNHSIGTLLIDVSEDVDLDTAVKKYEKIVAPSNYKRPKEIFTKKMLEDAKNTIEQLGYAESLGRRFATLDDISVNNILFSNRDSAKRITGIDDIFCEMEKNTVSRPKKFSKVDEVPVDKFVSDILPTASELEVYFENRHAGNMVSLIAPKNMEAPSMFKWNNNFGWAYSGNMTDSMKERVKEAGGRVDGDLRFSIQWNDIDTGSDNNDLDAHCVTPNGFRIYYADKFDNETRGNLDVDIRNPGSKVAVENITFTDIKFMTPGTYRFMVHQYCNRGGRKGFRAEIEFDGQVHSFDYGKELRQGETVAVAEVTLSKDGKFSIKELIPSNLSGRDVWGVKTNQFVPVSVVMYSPNYWDEQKGIGNKHYFFMMKDCVNPECPNGMFNEYLKEELLPHRRVMAALGSLMRVDPSDDQLSGLGFSSTKRDDLIVKVKGNTERVLKVKF